MQVYTSESISLLGRVTVATADPHTRMKLKKLPLTETSLLPDASNLRPSPEQEAEFLRHKHLGLAHEEAEFNGQKPMMGFGGKGRKTKGSQHQGLSDEDKDLFWAQMVDRTGNEKRMLKGPHGVPLSGELICSIGAEVRLHERSILRPYHHRYTTSGVQGCSRHWII
jgi:saccharopepsin